MISTADGKYKSKFEDGKITVLRHDKPWPEKDKDLIGDGYVLSLVQRIEELEEVLNEVIYSYDNDYPLEIGKYYRILNKD